MVAYQSALSALADPTRRTIFERLAAGPQPVVRLAEGLAVSRPAVSQHLRVLKDAGLAIDRQVGTRRLYQLNPDGLAALRGYLDRFWDQALAAFQAVADAEQAGIGPVGRPETTKQARDTQARDTQARDT